jgi:hypothetical protein
MPQQETFFEGAVDARRIEVIKTYDQIYAHESFGNMDAAAQSFLWNALKIDENYDLKDLPLRHDANAEDFLWEELISSAREYGNQVSFFVVVESKENCSTAIYVSPDWPSAESFAKHALTVS